MFTFCTKEQVFVINSNKKTITDNIKNEKALSDEFSKFIDGESDKSKEYFTGFVDFDLIDLKVYEDTIFFSGIHNRRMFFAKNKISFIGTDKAIYKKGICISVFFPFIIGILVYAIGTFLTSNQTKLNYSPLYALIFFGELIALCVYNYYKTTEENKEIDYLIRKVFTKNQLVKW